MKATKFILLFIALISFTEIVQSKNLYKWGKVTKEDLSIENCSYEPNADAIVLFDNCKVTVSYSSGVIYNRHVRIKLLNETAFDRADILLSYYRKDKMENITGIKAHTINVDENGKIEKLDIDSKSIFEVDVNENYGEKRFSFPQVKVGSIIEYKYTLRSNFYTFLNTWYFQTDIPTYHSQLEVQMPEGFDYRLVTIGKQLERKYTEPSSIWSLDYLPSIKEEPYVNNYKDYIEQIRFQLAGYYTQDRIHTGTVKYETTMTSWKNLALEYKEDLHPFYRRGWARKCLAKILVGDEKPWEKVEKIYDWVRLKINWNGKYRLYPKQSAPQLVESGIGTNAEINHLLVLLLQEAGVNASPALARTNDLGLIQKAYSMLSQFNQVLAYVEVYGKIQFLNATSKFRPYTLVAEEDLNHLSFVVDPKKPRWEEIVSARHNHEMQMLELDYSNPEEPSAQLTISQRGYYAEVNRRQLISDGEMKWGEQLLRDIGVDGRVDSVSVRHLDKLNKSLDINCSFSWESDLSTQEFFYLSPFLMNKIIENPFTAEKRQYRIDYNFPFKENCYIKIIPPKGYEFVEIPQSRKLVLPADIGKFTIFIGKDGNNLKLRTGFEINQPTVSNHLYLDLKEFYRQMISALKEQVVLKKTI